MALLRRNRSHKKLKAKVKQPAPDPLEEQREEVLKKARIHIKPLSIARHKVITITAAILVLLIVGLVGTVTYLIYGKHSASSLVYSVSRVVPYPASRVNGRWVSYADYIFEVRYRKNIYENPSDLTSSSSQPVDFKSAEGKKLLVNIEHASLEKAKTDAIIKQLARENKVDVSKKELNDAVAEVIKSQGGDKKFKTALKNVYGWDMNDFDREYYIQLLALKVQKQVSAGEKQQAEDVRKRAAGGEDFAALAKQFSQDPGSKDNGGDLGVVEESSNFIKEFLDAALKLKIGEVSPVVETRYGYHIIKAVEVKDGKNRIAHILIPYKDIQGLIGDKLKAAKTHDYVKLAPAEAEAAAPAPAQ